MAQDFYDANSRDDDAALSPTGMLLLFAQFAYDKKVGLPSSSRRLGAEMVQRVLDAAAAGGFSKCTELKTLLLRGKFSSRCKALAADAAHSAGRDVFDAIYLQFIVASANRLH